MNIEKVIELLIKVGQLDSDFVSRNYPVLHTRLLELGLGCNLRNNANGIASLLQDFLQGDSTELLSEVNQILSSSLRSV